LPTEVNAAMLSMGNFVYGSYISGFSIYVSTGMYQEGIEVDMEGAVNGAIQNLKAQKGVTNVSTQVADITVDGIAAKRIYGTLQAAQKEMIFNAILIGEKDVLRQVIIARTKGDTYAEKMEQRILASVELVPNND